MNKHAMAGARGTVRGASPADLLSCIRALAGSLRSATGCPRQRVGALIDGAVAARSPREIAVVLGAAAELRIFPDTRALDRCHDVVQCTDDVAVRAVLWVVRHRLARERQQAMRTPRAPAP